MSKASYSKWKNTYWLTLSATNLHYRELMWSKGDIGSKDLKPVTGNHTKVEKRGICESAKPTKSWDFGFSVSTRYWYTAGKEWDRESYSPKMETAQTNIPGTPRNVPKVHLAKTSPAPALSLPLPAPTTVSICQKTSSSKSCWKYTVWCLMSYI